MRYRIVSSACGAAMLAVVATAAGQGAPQAPAPSPAPGSTQSAPAGQQQREAAAKTGEVTVIGCVAREGDAASNQFVLRNAQMAPAAGATAAAGATKPGAGDSAVGTAGATAKPGAGRSFTLAGDRESSLATYVGQRVEIVGRMEAGAGAGVGAARPGDAGAQAGQKPGADAPQAGQKPGAGAPQAGQKPGAGPAGSMPELQIVSVKPAAGTCE